MTGATIAAGGAVATVLVLLALAAAHSIHERDADPAAAPSPAVAPRPCRPPRRMTRAARAEYARWSDVEQVDFDRLPAMSPPPETRDR